MHLHYKHLQTFIIGRGPFTIPASRVFRFDPFSSKCVAQNRKNYFWANRALPRARERDGYNDVDGGRSLNCLMNRAELFMPHIFQTLSLCRRNFQVFKIVSWAVLTCPMLNQGPLIFGWFSLVSKRRIFKIFIFKLFRNNLMPSR